MKPIPVYIRLCLSLLALSLFAGCNLLNVKQGNAVPRESRPAPQPVAPAPVVPSPDVEKANQELLGGIASYENGSYKIAARQLSSALKLGLESPAKQAQAHKYLAFMHCVEGRKALCRSEFQRAIEADPGFVLTQAEVGHPTWGPVFRKLKAVRKPEKK